MKGDWLLDSFALTEASCLKEAILCKKEVGDLDV